MALVTEHRVYLQKRDRFRRDDWHCNEVAAGLWVYQLLRHAAVWHDACHYTRHWTVRGYSCLVSLIKPLLVFVQRNCWYGWDLHPL